MYYITESPKDWEEKDVWAKLPTLLKEVLGYTDEEIKIFKDLDDKHEIGSLTLATNLTREQAILIQQPFTDNNIPLMCYEYDDTTKKLIDIAFNSKLGITRQPPKDHYYDEPVISSDQRIDPLVDPYYKPTVKSYSPATPPQPTRPTITCPTCGSTNTRKISGLERGVSVLTLGLMSRKINKSFKCNKCGYTW